MIGLAALIKKATLQSQLSTHTALPGIVESYDPAKRIASVTPALTIPTKSGERGFPTLHGVPVLFPGGEGFTLAVSEIKKGETVMLIFAERGIKNFIKTHRLSKASPGLKALSSAVAIYGFGALSISPPEGISLQAPDGAVKLDLGNDELVVKFGEKVFTITSDGTVTTPGGAILTADGDVLTSDGISLRMHVHYGVDRGSHSTDPPTAP